MTWWADVIYDSWWAGQPWDTWFWGLIPSSAWGWPPGDYQVRKISPAGGHQVQLAIRSPIARSGGPANYTVKANVVYILTYQNDTPNWGTSSRLVAISPPCGNWVSNLYETPNEVMRSQTFGILAAIQGEREKIARVLAAVAKTGELASTVQAAVMAQLDLPIEMHAAVMGERERALPMRAAVRTERLLESTVEAAVGKDFDLTSTILAAVQGNPHLRHGMRAAVKGEAEKTVGISAFVVNSRVDHIYLEFENLWPQEMDIRVPNWASRVKDYRKDSIG
jgi:hypothetical protein